MAKKSKIQWTDSSWNPFRGNKGMWHCVKVSPGCRNCYAESMNVRFSGPKYKVNADTTRLDSKVLEKPLLWTKPRRIFVCSMTDLFLEANSFEKIAEVFSVMATASQHQFQVLTKRPQRALAFFKWIDINTYFDDNISWPLKNVWFGVSTENQEYADKRIPLLLKIPATTKFVSAEPLLGPIKFNKSWLLYGGITEEQWKGRALSGVDPYGIRPGYPKPLDWIIVGGESGRNARKCKVEWIYSIINQCQKTEVACFVKQVGSKSNLAYSIKHSKGGDPLEWPENLRVREWPDTI